MQPSYPIEPLTHETYALQRPLVKTTQKPYSTPSEEKQRSALHLEP